MDFMNAAATTRRRFRVSVGALTDAMGRPDIPLGDLIQADMSAYDLGIHEPRRKIHTNNVRNLREFIELPRRRRVRATATPDRPDQMKIEASEAKAPPTRIHIANAVAIYQGQGCPGATLGALSYVVRTGNLMQIMTQPVKKSHFKPAFQLASSGPKPLAGLPDKRANAALPPHNSPMLGAPL